MIVGTGEVVAVGDGVAVGDAVAVAVDADAGTGMGRFWMAVSVGSGVGSAAVSGWNDKAKMLSVSDPVLF